jgi:3-oxoacyl-[acyl-carrier protein] reductase
MSDAVALVTGGSGRIGSSVCRRLAEEGFDVAVGYLQAEDEAREVAQAVEAIGSDSLMLPGDVTDRMVRRRLVQRTVDELGGLDVLVDAAGAPDAAPFGDVAPGELDRALGLDVGAVFHLVQLAGEHMQETGGGSIVNVAAAAGLQADPERATFSIAKAGTLAVTRSAAVALSPDVTVNAVAPGRVLGEDEREQVAEVLDEDATGAGSWTSPGEVAEAIVHLASAPSSMTGSVLRLDGGDSSQLHAEAPGVGPDDEEDLGLPGIEQRIDKPPEARRGDE